MTAPHSQGTDKVETEKTRFRIAPPGFTWKPVYFIPFILDAITSVAVVFLPVLVGRIIDLHSAGEQEQAWQHMYWLIAIILYFCIHEYFGWGITFRVVARIERAWRLHIAELVRQSSNRDAGSLIAILNKDSRAISNLWQPMIMAFSAVGITAMGTWQLWAISPVVAVVALAGLLITILSLTKISSYLEKHSDSFREKVGVNTSKASDIASSIRTILGLGARGRMMGRYRDSAQEVYESQLKLESVQTWSFAARNMLVGTVTLLAVAFALRGTMDAGTWITEIPAGQLVTIVGLINTLTGPIWSVEMVLYNWRNARVALRRVDRLADEVESQCSKQQETEPALEVEIPDVEHPVTYINPRLHGLTAQHYAEALTLALRARTGDRVLLSEPNPMIFAGTLREHMHLGTNGLTDEHIISLLKLTDSEEIAFRLGGENPADYLQAHISSEGANLSGGQRQRLALARALAQDTPVLVLTEPLNSVDEPSQKFILDRLEELTGQPGPLEHIRSIYLISTTMEAERRIAARTSPGSGATAKDYEQAITTSLRIIDRHPITAIQESEGNRG